MTTEVRYYQVTTSTYLFKAHLNTRQFVRETLTGLDVDKERLDDMTREHLQSSIEERVDIIYSDFVGITENEIELYWSRSDQLNRNKQRVRDYVDVHRKVTLSTHAAIERLADRLGMLLFNFLI